MGKGGIDEMERTTADGIKQSRPDFSWRLNAPPLLSSRGGKIGIGNFLSILDEGKKGVDNVRGGGRCIRTCD